MFKPNYNSKKFVVCLVLVLLNSFNLKAESLTVDSFAKLNEELKNNADADVVLDMDNVNDSISGNVNISEGQKVSIKNIGLWKNPDHEDDNRPRMMKNEGNLSLDNVNISNNNMLVAAGSVNGGAVIYNTGVINSMANVVIENNFVDTVEKADLWGGVIGNKNGGVIKSITDSKISNNTFYTKQSAPHGAVIYNGENDAVTKKGSTIELIDNVVFENNVMVANNDYYKGGEHGTIIDNNQYGVIEKITNSKFVGNRAYRPGEEISEGHSSGGAIDNYNIIEEISNTLFEGNNVETEAQNLPAMGGAIKNLFIYSYKDRGVEGRIGKIDNVEFVGNFAKTKNGKAYGGAYAGKDGAVIDKLVNSSFRGNYAVSDNSGAYGGAIYNGDGVVNIENTNFENNYAKGKDDTSGGAIWNSGQITFNGKNDFSGNYVVVDDVKKGNDIYNTGTITINENSILNINGGINGENGNINVEKGAILSMNSSKVENNTLNLADGSSVSLDINELKTDLTQQIGGYIGGDVSLNGKNGLKVFSYFEKGKFSGQGEYQFADNVDSTNGEWDLIYTGNGLYNYNVEMNNDKNRLHIDYIMKNAEGISETLNISKNEAYEVLAFLGEDTGNEQFDNISENINKLAQEGGGGELSEVINDINDKPERIVSVAMQSSNDIIKGVNDRLNYVRNKDKQGLSSGDLSSKPEIWLNTSYQKSKNSGDINYDADISTVIIGGDVKLNENVVVGAGYAHQNTDVDANNMSSDISSHSGFLYGSYNKNNWFGDAYMGYSKSDYEQNKSVFEENVKANFDVDVLASQFRIGKNYDLVLTNNKMKISPNIGIRYYNIKQDDYKDSSYMKYEGVDEDILTSLVGVNVKSEIVFNDYRISLDTFINALYDVKKDDCNILVGLPNGNNYIVSGSFDDNIAVEMGVGLGFHLRDNLLLDILYEYDWRENFSAHTGSLMLKYRF